MTYGASISFSGNKSNSTNSTCTGGDPPLDGYSLSWNISNPSNNWSVSHVSGRKFKITYKTPGCPQCYDQIVAGTKPDGNIIKCVASSGTFGEVSGTFTKPSGKPLYFIGQRQNSCGDAKDKFKSSSDYVGKITKSGAPNQVCCKNTSTGKYEWHTGSCGSGWTQVSDAKCEGKPKPGILDWIKNHILIVGGAVGGLIFLILLIMLL